MGGQRTSNPRQPSSISIKTTHNSTPLPPPTFRSVTATRMRLSARKWSRRRCKGREGKPEFQLTSQTYMEVTKATANVEHILGIISWWGPEYTLVTNDGLQIEDSTATQGMPVKKC